MSSSLNLDLWRRAEILFEAALDLPPRERADFLKRACGGNKAVRVTVESLLRRDQEDSPFLETPLAEPLSWTDEESLKDPWVGRRLGPYRLLRPIGVGGMGSVFLGERVDGEIQQQVAVKVIREEAEWGFRLRSLRQERQILAKLDHPNIARSLGGGTTEEGMPYIVLEYLDGLPLTEYCDAARLDSRQRLELFCKVCNAVDHAHSRLVVHRDIKPSNILVTSSGSRSCWTSASPSYWTLPGTRKSGPELETVFLPLTTPAPSNSPVSLRPPPLTSILWVFCFTSF